jgi:hypothetical protein
MAPLVTCPALRKDGKEEVYSSLILSAYVREI